jgi:UDP-glucose:(heptosyl)LPS alpha-1,3-glucosyltransferase
LRIAIVHMRHARVGGTERFLNAVTIHLAEQGHEVVIVCRRHVESPHPDVRFEVLHDFALGSSWRAWGFAKAVERHVRDAGYDLVFALGKTWSHDLLRSGGGCHQTYIERAHRYVKTPMERALGMGALKNKVALAIEERAMAPDAARRIIAISEMVKRDIVARHGFPAERVEVIHNGVDTERFRPGLRDGVGKELRGSLGWNDEHTVALFLGQGYGRKGLSRLLRSIAPLAESRPDLRVAVVGREHGQAGWEREAAELGLGDRIAFLGERGDPEACFAAGDLYVLPTHYDAFAFSVLEALATGLPVITTDQAGASELLGPAEGQVVAADGGDDELTAALETWLDKDRLAAAAAPARALAERYTFTRTLEQTTRVLGEVAAEVARG